MRTTGAWTLEGYRDGNPDGPLVVAYDFGIKLNILRNLVDMGCRVVVVPADAKPELVRSFEPDGVGHSRNCPTPLPISRAPRALATEAWCFTTSASSG